MTRTATIENTKTTKGLKTKATLALVSLLLALMTAAVGTQSAAVAAPAASDTASDKAPSVAKAEPAKSTLDDPAKKMPRALSKGSASEGSASGKMSARSMIVGQSGSPGHVALGPVWGVGYHLSQQFVSTPLADIYPSRAYSGNQVVTMKTTIGKREVFRGNYSPTEVWATPVYRYNIGSRGIQVPAKYLAGNDWTRNLYSAAVTVWWQTPGGRVLGTKTISLNQPARDYACGPGQNYGSYCNVWTNGLYLDRVG